MNSERFAPRLRSRIAGTAALSLLVVGVVAWVVWGQEPIKPPQAAETATDPTHHQPEPVATAPTPIEATRVPVPPAPTANWRTGLTPAQEARCLTLLEDKHADIVLVHVVSVPDVLSLDQLLGSNAPPRKHLRLRVLDGSKQLYLQRQQLTNVIWKPEGGDRDIAVGETFYAVLINNDPLAKLIDGPPRAIGLAFAGAALTERVTISTVQEVETSPGPPQQNPFQRLLSPFAERLRGN